MPAVLRELMVMFSSFAPPIDRSNLASSRALAHRRPSIDAWTRIPHCIGPRHRTIDSQMSRAEESVLVDAADDDAHAPAASALDYAPSHPPTKKSHRRERRKVRRRASPNLPRCERDA